MSEIKNCPFCDGKARISCDTEATRDSEGRLWAYTIVCDSCCATSGLTYTPDRAKEAWNTRKPIEDMVEQLEKRRLEYEIAEENACNDTKKIYYSGIKRGYEYSKDIVRGGRE